MVRLVTGGSGFIGRQLLRELAKRDGTTYVLVREGSRPRLEAMIAALGASDRMRPLTGDIGLPGLGLAPSDHAALQGADVYHLAAVYDLEASAEANERANVGGTRNVVAFAEQVGARLHHVSSIAVAGGKWKGKFTEEMFEEGQALDHPYYKTKYEAEALVRASGLRYRIYRPGLVVGSSETGVADRIDGPYYAFKLIQRLRGAIPPWVPLVGIEGGEINIVPVDFVARALAVIAHRPDLDGQTFHLTDPAARSLGEVTNEFCRAAHAPQFTLRVDSRAASMLPREMTGMLQHWRVAQTLKRRLLEGVRIPEAALQYVTNRARFTCESTKAALAGSGVECPPLHTYAWKIWDHWERHLDPEALTERNLRAVLNDRVVLVTGASSGIGRATAQLVAGHGAQVVLVSRSQDKLETLRAEIVSGGGRAFVYPTDLSDLDQCEAMIANVLADHGRVDILVNNAGRSIRRSIEASYDRFHDFQRTMQLNYFGAVKLILAVLPGMRQRHGGHIINISSIGTQAFPPRFGAYVASKSALAALSRCIGPEVADDGVAVTNIHMPLVRTPMIAPTGMYRNFPTSSPEEAAEMVASAILTRQPEVSTRLGKLGETVNTVAPGLLQFVMTGAYHVFPDTAGKDESEKKEPDEDEISVEAAAMAYLMRGIHF
ncbi:MAG TPA: SDR family oxidoreductase [Candidatus Dormibacteraeota bacterium]|nr:SDR family oxidoreductase [Candidatus Dormibacteraeota bacterium]